MPKVSVVEPNNTPEQKKEILKGIGDVLARIIKTEYGLDVNVNLYFDEGSKKSV